MREYYRHFKGGVYRIVSIAKDSGSEGKVVVYQAMYGDGDFWTRPFDEFFGKVEQDGRILARFTEISEKEALFGAPEYLKPWYHFPDIRLLPMSNPESDFSWGVKAMITLLQRRRLVAEGLFEDLLNDDDIKNEIRARIRAYELGDDPESIFHLIQVWGGSTGRGIYVRGGGFDWGYLRPKYEMLIRDCLQTAVIDDESIDRLVDTVKSFDKAVDHLGVSFITKHICFWLTRKHGDNALPIYDSNLALEVMHKGLVTIDDLADYWKVMKAKAGQLGIGMMSLERQIFQYSQRMRWLREKDRSSKVPGLLTPNPDYFR